MNIKIYQVNTDRDDDRVAFASYDSLTRLQSSEVINSEIYDKVFEGEVERSTLEGVYSMFNIDYPENYRGRSLSVSDVVEVISGESSEFYYCDSFGFKKIEFDSAKVAKQGTVDPLAGATIKVVMVEPGAKSRVVEIGSSLEEMQTAVGGYIEVVYPYADEVCLVCNEEGKLNGMDLNRAIRDEYGDITDIIAGPFFICDCSEENFGSLSEELCEKYTKKFMYPERFFRRGSDIVSIPYTE